MLLGGCQAERRVPQPPASEQPAVAAGDASGRAVGGVSVSAAADAWPGEAAVPNHVTPLRVTVRNDGDAPIRLHLCDMRMLDDSGRLHAALPLYEVAEDANGNPEVERHAHDPYPAFAHERYRVAQPYAPYYLGFPVDHASPGPGGGCYDYARYYRTWDALAEALADALPDPLPTERMVDLAIPEGVVEAGGYVSGFVFFERVDPARSSHAAFMLDLVDARSGQRLGAVELAIPAAS